MCRCITAISKADGEERDELIVAFQRLLESGKILNYEIGANVDGIYDLEGGLPLIHAAELDVFVNDNIRYPKRLNYYYNSEHH